MLVVFKEEYLVNTKILKDEKTTVEAIATLDGEEWKSYQTKALKKLASNVTIKGFRKGEAPIQLAQKKIKDVDVLNEAVHSSIDNLLKETVITNKINYYACRNTSITKCSADELEVKFIIVKVPNVTLGEYKGLGVAMDIKEITDADIDHKISHLLEDEAELIVKEGKAELGDTVVLDFKGYINGKEFEGGSAQNYELILGSNQFIPGFEDQLVGTSAGDKVDVNVTFPTQYVEELAGKDAKFACTIHEVKQKKLPELDDEFVKGLDKDGIETLDQLRQEQKEILKKDAENRARETAFREILNKIVENSTFDVAEEVIEQEANAIQQNFNNQLAQSGLTLEQYLQLTAQTEDKLNAQFKEEATKRLNEYLAIMAVGTKENITCTDEELEKYYSDTASLYGMEVEQVKKALSANEGRIKSQLVQDKIEKFILENNLTEAKAKKASKKTTKEAK